MDNHAKDFARNILAKLEKIICLLSNKPRQEEVQTAAPSKDTHDQGYKAKTPERSLTVVTPAPDEQQETASTQQKGWDRWRIAEAIGIVAAVGVAIINCLQWRDAHHAFLSDQRPYIRVTILKPDIVIDMPLQVKGSITNLGKTPASEVYSQIEAEIVPRDEQPVLDLGDRMRLADLIGILFPNSESPEPRTLAYLTSGGTIRKLDARIVNSLNAGDSYIAVHGTVTYSDFFGTKHWTHVCNWFGYVKAITYQAKNCAQYNQVDSNPY